MKNGMHMRATTSTPANIRWITVEVGMPSRIIKMTEDRPSVVATGTPMTSRTTARIKNSATEFMPAPSLLRLFGKDQDQAEQIGHYHQYGDHGEDPVNDPHVDIHVGGDGLGGRATWGKL